MILVTALRWKRAAASGVLDLLAKIARGARILVRTHRPPPEKLCCRREGGPRGEVSPRVLSVDGSYGPRKSLVRGSRGGGESNHVGGICVLGLSCITIPRGCRGPLSAGSGTYAGFLASGHGPMIPG